MLGFLLVGLGGAVGAMARYAISLLPYEGTFPLLTWLTNICGAVLIGYVTGVAEQKVVSAHTMLFLRTGVCGGFTTFSAFSLEAYNLMQQGSYEHAAWYIALSTGICILGIWCGMCLAKATCR